MQLLKAVLLYQAQVRLGPDTFPQVPKIAQYIYIQKMMICLIENSPHRLFCENRAIVQLTAVTCVGTVDTTSEPVIPLTDVSGHGDLGTPHILAVELELV